VISIFPKIFIQDVFYVEKCSINLLSISKLANDLNYEVIFKKKNMIFQDPLTKEKIGEGYLENNLYFLSTNKSCFNAKKNYLYKVWNKRMGHPSDKILKLIVNGSQNYCSNCEVCSLANHTKLLFCNSNSKSNEKFKLVHSDVWGPAPITYYNDF
jgi:hypothetical protein